MTGRATDVDRLTERSAASEDAEGPSGWSPSRAALPRGQGLSGEIEQKRDD